LSIREIVPERHLFAGDPVLLTPGQQIQGWRTTWFWGILLVAAVVVAGLVLPAAARLLLAADPRWAVPVMVTGFTITWSAFIAAFRFGKQRGWVR